MTEVICLGDSDDDVAAPAAASRPSSSAAVPPPAPPPVRSDIARGAQPRAISDDGFGTSSSDDEGIFTDHTANRRAAKKRRVAAPRSPVPPRDKSSAGPPRTRAPRAAPGSVRDGAPSEPKSPSARARAARDAARDEKARAAEETRRRKALSKELARQAKEREKVAKANAKHRAALLGGKHKLRQITALFSSDLAGDDLGRALADAFTMGVVDDGAGRSVVPLFHAAAREGSASTPLPRSVTWRYHAPAAGPVGDDGAFPGDDGVGATSIASAEYTLVHFTGAAFAAACAADHDARVHENDASKNGGLFPDELPERGLERLLATARKKLPGHTLGLLLEGVRRECANRERREFRAPSSAPGSEARRTFSRAIVEDAIARLHVSDRGVRVTCVPDRGASVRHVVGVTTALAKRPFEREIGPMDVLAHAKSKSVTPTAARALEAAAAGGSRGAGVGSDGVADGVADSVGDASASGFSAGPSRAPSGSSRAGRRPKTCAETWCAALMCVDGCAESSALAICRAFPTMASLMREYARTDLAERAKRDRLANLTREIASETQTRGRRVGPALSARVYAILRPRGANDAGDEIVGVGG